MGVFGDANNESDYPLLDFENSKWRFQSNGSGFLISDPKTA